MIQTGLDALITYNPWTLVATTTLGEAVRLLDETGIGQWPVVDDDGRWLGSLDTELVVSALGDRALCDAPVSEFMHRDEPPVNLGTSPRDALQRMRAPQPRFLAVVDGERVVGTLSPADFVRELSYGENPVARELIIDHMQTHLDPLDTEQTVDEALACLNGRQKDYAAVAQGDFPFGAVSRAALFQARGRALARQLRGETSPARTLGQILHRAPTTPPGRTLGEAASLMVEHDVDALAVANQAAHLLGIVTEDQIVQALLAAD
jgi:CBS domain-containing protein